MATHYNFKLLALQMTWLFLHETCSAAEPKVRCTIEQGGVSQSLEAGLTTDPYAARAINVNNRFRFKPVIVGKEGTIDYIKFYSYYTKGERIILLHLIKHFPPSIDAGSEISLGKHYVYAPVYEREMQYSCVLYRPN
jgi:hypothetical protein